MNHFKKYLSLLLALTLMLSAFSGCGKKAEPAATEAAPVETTAAAVAETEAAAEQSASDADYNVGDKIDDFTITTYDGKEVNLYKLLEEKHIAVVPGNAFNKAGEGYIRIACTLSEERLVAAAKEIVAFADALPQQS